MVISSFRGKWAFLSNFYESPVTHRQILFGSAEAAFQASKLYRDWNARAGFAGLRPEAARKAGRQVPLPDDWERIKTGFMFEIVESKFRRGTELADLLMSTGDAYLVEVNTWGDRFWGVDGYGENMLGQILMNRRTALQLGALL